MTLKRFFIRTCLFRLRIRAFFLVAAFIAAGCLSMPAWAGTGKARAGAAVQAGPAGAVMKGRAAKDKQAAVSNKTGPTAAEEKGPIVITSQRLSADSATRTAVFSGMVQATNNHMWLYADRMVVHYGEAGGVKTIDSTGNVRFIKEDSVVTSDKALYTRKADNVVFTGNPKLSRAGTVVTGTSITYYVTSGNMAVQNSRVFIQGK